ncbi:MULTISPECIES: hypothetical protein [Vibrio]|uniref:hypothetical protein n=1 Tax=Vibrio TaxID=662 RepID=UPI00207508E4|nr:MULTISPECIES: hypothetical protein [Vibrio]USD35617.1 hypothetical protein J8Z27_22680 [Vibrio sp. SCSIO 43186]USD72741.1 hypothetical protein J4N41_22685 [Vibrio sp. SCSIO 43139]USD98946.1 hypothetical protein CTT30_23010 [Vibrio coralliilyticus]
MVEQLDLKAEQCPHVMSIVRTALLRAVEAGFTGQVQIRTIEVSVPEKLQAFVASMDNKVSVQVVTSCKLDETRRAQLLATEDISESQLSRVQSEQFINVEIH